MTLAENPWASGEEQVSVTKCAQVLVTGEGRKAVSAEGLRKTPSVRPKPGRESELFSWVSPVPWTRDLLASGAV